MAITNKQLKLYIPIGFGVVVGMMLILSYVSISGTRRLGTISNQSFNHPFIVSNALLTIRENTYAMHSTMKDLPHTTDISEHERLMTFIDSCESVALAKFSSIQERYLGDPRDVQIAVKAFTSWKPVRNRFLQYIHRGELVEAFELIQHQDREKVDNIIASTETLLNFAHNKRNSFLEQSRQTEESVKRRITWISGILILLATGIGVIVSIRIKRDIVRLDNMQTSLYQSQKLESIGRLAGGIAHDFNNMLMPIISYSELMMKDTSLRDMDREQLEQINLAGRRAAELTRQLLAFSRKQILEMKVINLNDVVTELQKMLKRLIGEDIELNTVLNQELGNVKADRAQLDQILLNLVVNARDAMPKGGDLLIETGNVYLDEAYASNHAEVTPGDFVMLAVSDSGAGMDKEVRERLFEPFFTTKEHGQGTGLGLATIFGIVKQHGGHINAYSEPGQGSTFKVYLPLAVEPKTVFETVVEPVEPGKGETVLVVEDEEIVRDMVAELLNANGYSALESSSGDSAIKLAQHKDIKVDLLITDVVMPGMNGRELYKRLAEMEPGLKVLYMSGYTDNVITHHGILDEGTHFLQKPFTESTLLKKVHELLD